MLKNITITFDELERRLFETISSPSILGGPESDEKGPAPRLRLVRRAAQGEPLSAVELAALKRSLEEATEEREANYDAAKAAGNDDLASGFKTWLAPLGEAWALVCEAESVALGGTL
jgi:hypothetical protein